MLGRLGITLVAVAVVLAACSSSGTDEQQEEADATTSTTATTTTAPEPTVLAETVTTTTAEPATTTTTTTTSAPSVETGEELVGDWFACEFVETPGSPPVDGCAMFDDDGLWFGPEGQLSAIEALGLEEVNCLFGNPGRCFATDLEDIEIAEEPLGTWSLSGTTISVFVPDCTGTLEWEQGEDHSVFRPGAANGCGVLELDGNATDQAQAGLVYFGRYLSTQT